MPAIVADGVLHLDAHHPRPATHVVQVAHLAVDELDGEKVALSADVQHEPVALGGLQLHIEHTRIVERRVSLSTDSRPR